MSAVPRPFSFTKPRANGHWQAAFNKKTEGRRLEEARTPKSERKRLSVNLGFGLWPSFGHRISGFGLPRLVQSTQTRLDTRPESPGDKPAPPRGIPLKNRNRIAQIPGS